MKKRIEPKLNEVFEWKGKRYRCIKDDGKGCVNCVFNSNGNSCYLIACGYHGRRDGIEVIFKKI